MMKKRITHQLQSLASGWNGFSAIKAMCLCLMLALTHSATGQNSFTLVTWGWDCGSTELTIEFNQNVDAASATNLNNYSFSPQGAVTGVAFNPPSSVVMLTVTGLSTTGFNILTLSNLFSESGEPLDNDYTQFAVYCHHHPHPNTPPQIDCPPDLIVDCAPAGGSLHTVSVQVEDADGDPLTVIWYVDGLAVQTDNFAAAPPPHQQTVSLTYLFPIGTSQVSVSVNDAMQLTNCAFSVTIHEEDPWLALCPHDLQEIFGADCPAYTPDLIPLLRIDSDCWLPGDFIITQSPAVGTPLPNGTNIVVLTIEGPDGVIQYCDVPVLVDCPPPGPCDTLLDSLVLNTGWNHLTGSMYPAGQVDTFWTVVDDPDPGTTEPRPVFVLSQFPLAWQPALPNSRWVSAYASSTNNLNGTYALETTFCLAPGWSNAVLDFELRADDWAEVFLNGNAIGVTPNPSFNNGTPTAILENNQALFLTGTNTIRVHMNNSAGAHMGINLAGTVSADGLSIENPVCCNPGVSLSGRKFFDTNMNGLFDAGEPVLAGWTIEATDGVNLYTAVTDSNGYYYFMGLPSGTYTLTEVQQPGYTQTAPAGGSYLVTVGNAQGLSGLDFGNVRIEVEPNEPPEVICPGDQVINCVPSSGTNVSLTAVFSDPDGDPLSYSWFINGSLYASGGIPAGGPPTTGSSTISPLLTPGTHVITVTVNDGGAEATCRFTVTIRGESPPQLFCRNGTMLTLPLNDDCAGVVPAMAYFIDPGCTPLANLIVTQTPLPGTLLPPGVHWVSIEVYDPLTGQTLTCRYQIRFADLTPPTVVCPSLPAVLACDAVIPDLIPDLIISDNCDNPGDLTVLQTPAAGTPVGPGNHTITISVIDSSGNVSQCSSILSVLPSATFAQPIALFNTGVDSNGDLLAHQQVDPHYILTTSVNPQYPGPDAYATQVPNTWWVPNSATSRWISPTPLLGKSTTGTYVYTKTFTLPANMTGAVISGRWATDNNAEMLLNGVPTGFTKPYNGFLAWDNFVLTSGFQPGVNTLEFVVNMIAVATGLRVELEGEVFWCDFPCTPPTAQVLPVFSQTGFIGGTAVFTANATGSGPLSYQWFFNGNPILGANGPTLILSPLGLGDTGLYSVSVSNHCGAFDSRPTFLRVLRRLIIVLDKWQFPAGSPKMGMAGSNIGFEELDPEFNDMAFTWTLFRSTSDFGIPGPDGMALDVMRFARTRAGQAYFIETDTAGSQQSFVFDLYFPAEELGNLIPLLQLNPANDGDATVYAFVTLPGEGDPYGCPVVEVPAEQWTRVVITVDFASGALHAYVDGTPTLHCLLEPAAPSLKPLLFTDAGEFPFYGYISSLTWFRTILNPLQASAFGRVTADGPDVRDPFLVIPDLAVRSTADSLVITWEGEGFGLETSRDLIHWDPLPFMPEADPRLDPPVFFHEVPFDGSPPLFIRGVEIDATGDYFKSRK